jgi:IclR family transcriptional regulator, KDG regulon repressor
MQPKERTAESADQPGQEEDAGQQKQSTFVGRVLLLLGEIASNSDSGPLSLSELTRRTGLPKSTVHRLLGILESQGAVERNIAGYQLGTETQALTGRVERDDMLRRVLMPLLVNLYVSLHEAVSLAVLRAGRVVYLETIFEDAHRNFVHRSGLNGPVHATASGKLLLAYRPALAARYGTDLPLTSFTDRTITTAAGFAAELARIRRDGIAFNIEEHLPGGVGVAAPVLGRRRTPVAAIAVGGRRAQMDVAAAVSQIRLASEAASATLALVGQGTPLQQRNHHASLSARRS